MFQISAQIFREQIHLVQNFFLRSSSERYVSFPVRDLLRIHAMRWIWISNFINFCLYFKFQYGFSDNGVILFRISFSFFKKVTFFSVPDLLRIHATRWIWISNFINVAYVSNLSTDDSVSSRPPCSCKSSPAPASSAL